MNPEWFRNPPSPLERTLRRPVLRREIIRLFLVRFLPLWFFCSWAFWLILGLSRPGSISGGIGFFFAVLIEMFWLRWWYTRFWLPVQLLRVEQIKRLTTDRKVITTRELIERVERSVNLATRGLVEIGYVGLPTWGWEIIFRALYPLLVKPPRPPYHELLIGFPNKTVEGDQMLWEINQMRDRDKDRERDREKRIEEFIETFGSKVEDVDLALPTLAENSKVIASMIALYRNSPSPFSILQKAKAHREEATEGVLQHVRIPQSIFKKFLDLTQQNVRLREDRRHYEFLGDYPIRLMLKELAKRLEKSEGEFSQMSWYEIKNTATDH